jgi:transcriptional regulator with XRE-family HTH domain
MRLACGLTQAEAELKAKELRAAEERRLGIRRRPPRRARKKKNHKLVRAGEEWSDWENARHLPERENLRWVAAALQMNEAAFLRILRLPIPQELLVHDEQELANDCLLILQNSHSFIQLIGELLPLWQQFVFEQIGARPTFKIDFGYVDTLESVYLYLDRKQQVTLACQLLENAPVKELRKRVQDLGKFFTEMEEQMKGPNRFGLSETLSADLEKLGVAGHQFTRFSPHVSALIERVQKRHEEPIDDPDGFAIELAQNFEVLRKYLQEYLDLSRTCMDPLARLDTLLPRFEEARLTAFENFCQAFEMLTKIQHLAAAILNPPQQALSKAEDIYKQKKES